MGTDVIVVGLGSMGAATAHQLASRGLRVVGIDRYRPPHTNGAHAGGSRIIRLAYAEGVAYVPLLRRAYELWAAIERSSGVDLLTPTGGLMLGRPDSSMVAGALASARTHGLAHELLDAAQIRRRFPVFAPRDDEVGVYEEVAGFVRPEATVATLLDLAGRAGADLRYGVRATGWSAGPGGVTVRTDEGELTAGRLVLCPGAGAGELIADLNIPLRAERRVQHFWPVADAGFALGRCPIWLWESAAGVVAYGFPGADPPPGSDRGGLVVKTGVHVDPNAVPRSDLAPAQPAEAARAAEVLTPLLPALASAGPPDGIPCLYTLTPDEHFVVGPHPRHDSVTVAAGFSGHGFKFVPVIGEIVADLAQHGSTRHDISLFAPDRFGQVAA
ncbi:N-methyl-L-tryptophan oxidase [Polymorphospora sp. NPDC051019]|uniref:N-methyl-L-tryptophan oxidase n=1 Tax=Polymorphospora sp. NPDC051019 TaxID=3155725 RepID=UPI0034478B50